MVKILKIMSYLSALNSTTSRDLRTGIDHWGTVKVPERPLSREYSPEDQQTTYNVLV